MHTRWKMKKFRHLVYFLILVLGTGCAPMKEIEIQVMVPAELTLPLHVHEIAFINRSVTPRLMHPDSSGWTEEEYYIMDTIMNNWIFLAVRKTMMESPLFDLDTLNIIRSRRSDTTGFMSPLTSSQLQQIRQVHPADAVISLDYYDLVDSSKVYMVSILDDYGYPKYAVEAYLGLYTTSLWRIYDLIQDSILDEHLIHDTLEWYHTGDIVDEAVDGLPEAIDAIREAAFHTGTIYGERICPGWMKTQRYYYASGSEEMRRASERVRREDWDGAASIWEKISSGENDSQAAKASFNLALVCEMKDLYIPALDWAIKSYYLRQKELTLEYIRLLRQRYEQQKKLDYQVPSGHS